MEKTERISVVIPVYNTAKYLEKSVRSVMDQTYRNLEIICVNDGSTDNSLEILRKLQKEDDRIIVIDKENGGLGDARNSGMKIATSKWITFVDSDDFINPDTYEKVSDAFAAQPELIHFGTRIVMESNDEPSAKDEKYYSVNYSGFLELNDYIIRKSDVAACNKLFLKSVIDRYSIHFEKIYYEDFPFTLQYMFSVKTIYCIQDKLYNYVRHSGSIMAETYKRTPRAIEHLYGAGYLFSFLKENGMVSSHESLLAKLFVDCYSFSVRYSTTDMIPQIVEAATGLFDSYSFLHHRLVRKEENGTIYFARRHKGRLSTRLLQKLFSIRLEYMDYNLYKVVRLFNVVLYKEYRSAF